MRRTIVTYLLLVLIIFSLPVLNPDGYKKKETAVTYTIKDVQKLFPDADSYRANGDRSNNVFSANGDKIGQFIVSNDFIESNFGYGGEINVLTGFQDHTVKGIVLLDHAESRAYVRKVESSGLFGKWNGKELSEIPTERVDAVGGATMTSGAVIRAVKESVADYLSVMAENGSVYHVVKAVLFLLIIVLSVVCSFKKNMSRYRIAYLIVLIVISGFVLQMMLSVSLLNGWLKQGFSFSNSWMSVALLILAVLMPLLGKNRYYCTYLCPMGALQELTGKLSPFKKQSLRFLKFRYFAVNDLFLLLIVVAMFCSVDVDFSNWEPFAAFAIQIASWTMLLFGGVVVLLSLFFNRPWCAMCPTGCALNQLAIRRKNSDRDK